MSVGQVLSLFFLLIFSDYFENIVSILFFKFDRNHKLKKRNWFFTMKTMHDNLL